MLASIVLSTYYVFIIFQLCSSQVCLTKKQDTCIFPFEYQNKIYTACKPDDNKPESPWCSIQVDSEGRHIEGRRGVTWGECSTDCPVEGDKKCEETNHCIYAKNCLEYKEFRNMSKDAGYETEKNKWRSRICNKKERKLCCPKPKSGYKCEGGQQYPGTYLPTLGQCGKICSTGRKRRKRVIGGFNVRLGEFPWAALLGYTIKKRIKVYPSQEWVIKKRTVFRCGGTLINTRYVITAAQCHTGGNKISSVVLGELNVGQDPDCLEESGDRSECMPRRQKIEVESVTVHENYHKTNEEVVNDIALIRLTEHAVLNEAVQPICLPIIDEVITEEIGIENLEDGIVGRDSTIIGWGETNNFGSKNSDCQGVAHCILQKVDLPIISNDDCQLKVNEVNQNSTIRSSHICAFSEESRDRDFCKGDSGGGMFINKNLDDKTDDTFYQVGIISYGFSRFCGIGYPSVYTRISEFIPWIEEKLQA